MSERIVFKVFLKNVFQNDNYLGKFLSIRIFKASTNKLLWKGKYKNFTDKQLYSFTHIERYVLDELGLSIWIR